MNRIIAIFIALLFLCGCKTEKETTVSFYYWKTVFELSKTEKETLANNKVTKLYVRYFDVALENAMPIPLSPIVFKDLPEKVAVVPVIYLKNEVLLQANIDLNHLAGIVFNYIEQINKKYAIPYSEIQLDCDWTLKSKTKYLKFVSLFKQITKKQLSATIRLHQIKYFRETSYPNVDRGVLMYYNMGKLAPDSINSIYDRSIAQGYIKSLRNYPLKLTNVGDLKDKGYY